MQLDTPQRYYKELFKRAFTAAWAAVETVSLLVGIAAAVILLNSASAERTALHLTWILPLLAFVAVFNWRLAIAAFSLHREQAALVEAANAKVAELSRRWKRRSHYQSIADKLTEKHKEASDTLLNRFPRNDEELAGWMRRVNPWCAQVRKIMVDGGCTPQDLNHVDTISEFDLAHFHGNVPGGPEVKRFIIRVSRVADISAKYADLAEDV